MAKNKLIICRRLKGLVVEHDMTIKKLSKIIGISENSLTLKVNGYRSFWLEETLLITKYFGLSKVEDVFPELYSAVIKSA